MGERLILRVKVSINLSCYCVVLFVGKARDLCKNGKAKKNLLRRLKKKNISLYISNHMQHVVWRSQPFSANLLRPVLKSDLEVENLMVQAEIRTPLIY